MVYETYVVVLIEYRGAITTPSSIVTDKLELSVKLAFKLALDLDGEKFFRMHNVGVT